MSDNVRLWMGAFKSMSDTERGYGIFKTKPHATKNMTSLVEVTKPVQKKKKKRFLFCDSFCVMIVTVIVFYI